MSAPHTPATGSGALTFISVEAMSGIVLILAAALALLWANSPWAPSYEALWHLKLALALPQLLPAQDLHFWVNDGLMTVFFLVVGLEIRREIHAGELSNLKVAVLPIIAALGGVLAPALLYLSVNHAPATRDGWAIPTATDIAFAVGMLALIPRVPPALRMLLLTLAIIDDIAAIIVIALVYSGSLDYSGLLFVAGGIALILAMHRLRIAAALPYVLPGAIIWLGMLRTGVHPTLTGVLLGLLTPVRADFGRTGESPLQRVESGLHPYVAFGIMPVFALANAGVSLAGLEFGATAPLAAGAGIILGLVVGKPLGVMLAARAAVRLGWCALPEGVRWPHIAVLGTLAGVGFTMSIFIAQLAFAEPSLLTAAKFAVLVASALAAVLGLLVGALIPAAPTQPPPKASL